MKENKAIDEMKKQENIKEQVFETEMSSVTKENSKDNAKQYTSKEDNFINIQNQKLINDAPSQPDNRSYIEVIYDEIVKAIGGDNPSQYFMMTFPAQVINPKDYEYDIINNAPKGPVVEYNESRLANKLFDPCQITGADNGMMLSNQYKSALDVLTPKLDAKMAVSKEKLRNLLLTKYPYDFGNGLTNNQTLQSVYFKLYDEYVEANQRWAELQNDVKEKIRKKYQGGSEEDNKKAKEEYLSWYETVAQAELVALNEKYSKVLSVFSPTDMDILEGVLDSGVGSELENAKRIMRNFVKQSPGGGDIYPVNFIPSDWFNYIKDNNTQIDLLDSPDVIGMELAQLYVQKDMITKRLISMESLIRDDVEDIEKINKDIEEAQNDIDENYNNLFSGIAGNVTSVVKGIVNVAALATSTSTIKAIFDKLGAKVSSGDLDKFVSNVKNNSKKILDAQNTINQKTLLLANKYAEKLASSEQKIYKNLANEIKAELDSVNEKISDTQARLQLSSSLNSAENDTEPANPYAPPKGFTQILIEVEASSATSDKLSTSSSLVSNEKNWYLFGSSSSSSAESNSHIDEELQKIGSKIQVGMNIIKIGIEREWFNPGIFLLTKNMYNTSQNKISQTAENGSVYHANTKEFIEQIHKSKNGYILPCFPVAMIVARDVVIKYSTNSSNSSFIMNTMHEESSKGHSIFGFGKTEASANDYSATHSSSQMSSNSITIRFSSPQILGYYMEITPADQSEIVGDQPLTGVNTNIDEYVDSYKKMLDKINEKIMQEDINKNKLLK